MLTEYDDTFVSEFIVRKTQDASRPRGASSIVGFMDVFLPEQFQAATQGYYPAAYRHRCR